MCSCKHVTGKSNVNGQPGYAWQPNDRPSVRPPADPDLKEGEEIVFNEPGRCTGGVDSHSHDIAMVKPIGVRQDYVLLCHNGLGHQRMPLRIYGPVVAGLAGMDSDTRYHALLLLWSTVTQAARDASQRMRDEWATAYLQDRIMKRRKDNRVSVWTVTKEEKEEIDRRKAEEKTRKKNAV